MSPTPGPRAGRGSTGEPPTRDRILAAAREEFAAHGFRGTTMRSIAAAAGVDVALLAHYFGNKDGLFAESLDLPDSVGDLLRDALSGSRETEGERLTRAYLGLWEDPATGTQMRVVARSALTNELAATRLRSLLSGLLGDPVVQDLIRGRRAGFMLAVSQLLGIAVIRYVVRVPPLATLDLETVVRRTSPLVQVHLDTPDES